MRNPLLGCKDDAGLSYSMIMRLQIICGTFAAWICTVIFDFTGLRVHPAATMSARILPLLLTAALCACQQAPAPTSSKPKAAAPRIAALNLAGEWRVTAINGVAVKSPLVLALTADGAQIWWEPRCAGMVRGYRIDGPSVKFAPVPPPPGTDPNMPIAVCEIGLPPNLDEVFAVLDTAQTVREISSAGMIIEGAGRSVAIMRP